VLGLVEPCVVPTGGEFVLECHMFCCCFVVMSFGVKETSPCPCQRNTTDIALEDFP
jgi:hypothetical protein